MYITHIMMMEFLEPDDFHHHLRDGECLKDVVRFAARSFGRIVVMPNLKPPVRSVVEAREYFDRIMSCMVEDTSSPKDRTCIDRYGFQPLMTLYLTDSTTREDVIAAKNSGLIHAYKLYPAGATTNSEFGVTSLDRILVALQVEYHVPLCTCCSSMKQLYALQTMSEVDLPLLVHGEVVDPTVDIFDREAAYIDTVLKPIVEKCPSLRIVMEHITTKDAVDFIKSRYSEGHTNIAATITAHHLLYNRNDIFKGGICPHMYCLPILKRETHRLALVEASTSGIPQFFIGVL